MLRDRGVTIEDASLEALLETKKELFPQAIGDHALYPGAAECIARVAAHVPVAIASGALAARDRADPRRAAASTDASR